MDAVKIWGDKMTKDEARKALLETLEEYCHDKGYNLQVFAGMADWVYTLYPLQKKMTNGDWIRSMSEEQLKKFLIKFSDANECDYCGFYKSEICSEECEDGLLLWLKQEADND